MGTQAITTHAFPIKPPTYTHTVKKLQMNCMLPQCVGGEWLHTAEVSGTLVSVRHRGIWVESFWAKLSRGPESWSLANPIALFSSRQVTTYHFFFQMKCILSFHLIIVFLRPRLTSSMTELSSRSSSFDMWLDSVTLIGWILSHLRVHVLSLLWLWIAHFHEQQTLLAFHRFSCLHDNQS